jgi:hypothetical protein
MIAVSFAIFYNDFIFLKIQLQHQLQKDSKEKQQRYGYQS